MSASTLLFLLVGPALAADAPVRALETPPEGYGREDLRYRMDTSQGGSADAFEAWMRERGFTVAGGGAPAASQEATAEVIVTAEVLTEAIAAEAAPQSVNGAPLRVKSDIDDSPVSPCLLPVVQVDAAQAAKPVASAETDQRC